MPPSNLPKDWEEQEERMLLRKATLRRLRATKEQSSPGPSPAVPDSLVRTRKLALAIKAQAAKEREVGLSPRENANRKPWIPFDRSFSMGEVNKPSGLATAARNLIADAEKRAAGPVDMQIGRAHV